jgi:hypothetical protein
MKDSSGNRTSLSMGCLSGKHGGGLLYWRTYRICKGRHWKQASLSIETPLGSLERVHLPGTLRYINVRTLFLGPRGCKEPEPGGIRKLQ